MRLAAIDVGTNAVLLTIVDATDGALRPVLERATITRLGEGVDASRRLAAAAVERTIVALERYAEELSRCQVERVVAVGTSALRDAHGSAAFRRRFEQVLGVPLRVISGDDEARLTFEGGLSGLSMSGDVVLFDIGGGSTEIVVSTRRRASLDAVSLDVGSVRLFERHVLHDPPSAAELDAVRAAIARALEQRPPAPKGVRGVGVAGTVTTLYGLAAGRTVYDASAVHGGRLALPQVRTWAVRLAGLPLARRRELPGMEPGRADVLPVGALLLQALCEAYGLSEIVVSDRGVRWGLLERIVRGVKEHPP